MLSRVANCAYWMSRYVCRVENMARFFSEFSNLSLENTDSSENIWEFLLQSMGNTDMFLSKYPNKTRQQKEVLHFLAFDLDNPNSLLNCLHYIKTNSKQIREKISSEMWLSMNDLHVFVSELSEKDTCSIQDFEFIRDKCLLYYSLLDSSIARKELWQFAKTGIRLEQADITSRLLQAIYLKITAQSPPHNHSKYWLTLLKILDAYESYREVFMDINATNSIQYILLQKSFPRSVTFCLEEVQTTIHQLTQTPLHTFDYPIEKKIGRLKTNLDYIEIEELLAYGLDKYLEKICLRLQECDQLIYETFFSKPKISAENATFTVDQTPTRVLSQ